VIDAYSSDIGVHIAHLSNYGKKKIWENSLQCGMIATMLQI
jgi:hypothetical protein